MTKGRPRAYWHHVLSFSGVAGLAWEVPAKAPLLMPVATAVAAQLGKHSRLPHLSLAVDAAARDMSRRPRLDLDWETPDYHFYYSMLVGQDTKAIPYSRTGKSNSISCFKYFNVLFEKSNIYINHLFVSVCHYLLPVPSHPPHLPPNLKSYFFVVINHLLSSISDVSVYLVWIKAMTVKMPACQGKGHSGPTREC